MVRATLLTPRLFCKPGLLFTTSLVAGLAAGFLTLSSANSQTVVIGGPGGSSVQVNMGAAYSGTGRGISYLQTPGPHSSSGIDYSKSSRIVDGDEVINLVPPGSRPKKKKRVVSVKKKKSPKTEPVKKVAEKTDEPKVEVARIAPKKEETKPAPPSAINEKPTEDVAKSVTEKTATTPSEPMKTPVEKPVETAKTEPVITTDPAPVATSEPADPITPKVEKAEAVPVKATEAPAVKTETEEPTPVIPAKEAEPAQEKETQVAAVAPETLSKPAPAPEPKAAPTTPSVSAQDMQILFETEKSTLPGSAEPDLKKIAKALNSGEDRVQLIAYADAGSNSAARRLSLGRALVVRSKLMELGVPNNRIEVRALGKPKDNSPADRVDLKVIAR